MSQIILSCEIRKCEKNIILIITFSYKVGSIITVIMILQCLFATNNNCHYVPIIYSIKQLSQ